MRFEILVEGQTELTALSILLPKIVGEYEKPHKWKIHKHRGIGKIPDNPAEKPNEGDRTLLHNLSSKLRSYGAEQDPDLVVVVLVDLDDKHDCVAFKNQLVALLNTCDKKPHSLFCLAIEELEAWYLGDSHALKLAYPDMKQASLENYMQDSQVGTWEILAEIIYSGGLNQLTVKGKRSNFVLEEKKNWAKRIPYFMDINNNLSPSFNYFVKKLQELA
jgi:hypothetical protein